MKKQKNIPSSLGQIIGTKRNGIPVLRPTKSDIARNIARSRQLVEAADKHDVVYSGGIRDRE
jgi:hypothetical protein